MDIGVYKIESPSGNFYIGSSVNLKRRFAQHKRDLRRGTHINLALQNTANKYGVDNLVFSVIACVLDGNNIRDVEQIIIDDLLPSYNISKNAHSALFDKQVVDKRVNTISRPVVRLTDGAWFKSAYEAARAMDGYKQKDLFPTAVKNGWKWAGHFWKYADEDKTLEQVQAAWDFRDKMRKEKAKEAASLAKSKEVMCLNTGEVFASCRAAELAKGIHRGGVSRGCLGYKKVKDMFWKFSSDPITLEEIERNYANILSKQKHNQRKALLVKQSKRVMCKETSEIFPSVKEATKAKGIHKDAVRASILKGAKVSGYSWEIINA